MARLRGGFLGRRTALLAALTAFLAVFAPLPALAAMSRITISGPGLPEPIEVANIGPSEEARYADQLLTALGLPVLIGQADGQPLPSEIDPMPVGPRHEVLWEAMGFVFPIDLYLSEPGGAVLHLESGRYPSLAPDLPGFGAPGGWYHAGYDVYPLLAELGLTVEPAVPMGASVRSHWLVFLLVGAAAAMVATGRRIVSGRARNPDPQPTATVGASRRT